MKQYYKPMLAQVAVKPFSSKDWLFEIKWDGIRAISYVDAELSIRSRYDKELKYNFPELNELVALAKNTVLDGEIVIIREGRPDFQTLLERSRSTPPRDIQHLANKYPALIVIFDLLEKNGKPLLDLPLVERKRVLKEYVQEGKNVVLSEFVEEQGEAYYSAAIKRGLEGVMAKRKDSRYEPGIRSNNWLKIKKLLTCDCVIFGYTQGEGIREQTFGALILGLYNEERPVYVGKVGTGFSEALIKLLMKTFNGLKVETKTLQIVDVPERITWLKPNLVCEVVYQSITKDGKLRMPRFHGLGADKPPHECTLDQIKQTS